MRTLGVVVSYQEADPVASPDWSAVLSVADRLLDELQAAIITTDLTGRIHYANRFAAQLYGRPLAELIGSVASDFAAPVEETVTAEIAQALRERRAWTGDFEIVRADGTPVTVRATDSGIYDQDGRLIGVASVAVDVTERRTIEISLRASEARKSALLAAALDAVVSIDANGVITEFNPAAEAVFGYSRAEAVGQPVADLLIPPSLRDEHRRAFAAYLATGAGRIIGRRVELRARRRDGEEFPVEIAINEVDLPGETAFMASIRDITQRRRSEVALVESRELFANLAQTLQQSLLPPELPEVPGLDVAAHYRPAGDGTEIGGDFFDLFETGRGEWAAMIGDVQGKGAEAASLTALVRYSARAAAMKNRRPSVILSLVNEAVYRQHGDRYCTMVYARIRWVSERLRLTISSAGHPLPLLLRGDHVSDAGRSGVLLGAFPMARFPNCDLDMSPGDSLVLFTDGVTEGRSGTELWGDERLRATLLSVAGQSAASMAELVAERVVEFQHGVAADDLAILVLRVAG